MTLTVLFDCVDLGHSGGRVCPEDGLAVLPTGGVTTCIAAACRAHWKNTDKETLVNRENKQEGVCTIIIH